MSNSIEGGLAPSREGSVVLEIGGATGALVLFAPREWLGAEVDLELLMRAAPHVHSEVRQRVLPGGEVYAAVYPQLVAGEYEVTRTGQRCAVRGGEVTELELGAHEPAGARLHSRSLFHSETH